MSDEPKKPTRVRAEGRDPNQNAYCSFTNDEWRYKAMRNRDIRLGVIALASICGGCLVRYLLLHG